MALNLLTIFTIIVISNDGTNFTNIGPTKHYNIKQDKKKWENPLK